MLLAVSCALSATVAALHIPSYAVYAALVRASLFAVILERPEYKSVAPSARAPTPEFNSLTLSFNVPVALYRLPIPSRTSDAPSLVLLIAEVISSTLSISSASSTSTSMLRRTPFIAADSISKSVTSAVIDVLIPLPGSIV